MEKLMKTEQPIVGQQYETEDGDIVEVVLDNEVGLCAGCIYNEDENAWCAQRSYKGEKPKCAAFLRTDDNNVKFIKVQP